MICLLQRGCALMRRDWRRPELNDIRHATATESLYTCGIWVRWLLVTGSSFVVIGGVEGPLCLSCCGSPAFAAVRQCGLFGLESSSLASCVCVVFGVRCLGVRVGFGGEWESENESDADSTVTRRSRAHRALHVQLLQPLPPTLFSQPSLHHTMEKASPLSPWSASLAENQNSALQPRKINLSEAVTESSDVSADHDGQPFGEATSSAEVTGASTAAPWKSSQRTSATSPSCDRRGA